MKLLDDRKLLRVSPDRRGLALVVAVVMLTTLAVMSVAFLQVGSASNKRVTSSANDTAATYLAEAGVAEAMMAIRGGATGSVGTRWTPARMGDGVFWVEATDMDAALTRLVVTALSGSGRSALEVVVEDTGEPRFAGMIATKELVDLDANVVVDSYDSSIGDYASQAVNDRSGIPYANTNGHVRSNAGIDLTGGAGIFGDGIPGPGESVSHASGTFVTGSTTPATENLEFPPIEVPTLPMLGPMLLPRWSNVSLPPGDYRFSDLELGKDTRLRIEGPATIVVDSFTSLANSRLIVDGTNGPVTLHCQGSFHYDKALTVRPVTGSPADITWMLSGSSSVVFDSRTKVVGGFYAPDMDLTLTSDCEVWGALVAKRVDMDAGVRFHFDEYLLHRKHSGGEILVRSWTQARIAVESLNADRRDPFEVLDLDRSALPKPADAWDI